MNQRNLLLRNISALGESIRRDWADLSSLHLTSTDRHGIRRNIAGCVRDMMELLERLENEKTAHREALRQTDD